VRCDRGTGRFTTSEVRFGGSSDNAALELYCLTAWRHERGRFLPTALLATEPLAPLSQSPGFTLAPRPPSRALQSGRTPAFWTGWYGSEDAETAETTVGACS
jgi:hypothetical protein